MLHEEIHKIILNSLDLTEIADESSFISSLDSIQKLSILVALEDHYSIILEPNPDEPLESLQSLVSAVEKRISP